MSRTNRNLRLGRTGWAALACALSVLTAGALLFNRQAVAQGNNNLGDPILFSPQHLNVLGTEEPGVDNILIGLLVPAVQSTAVPFKVQVICDGSVTVLDIPNSNQRQMAFFDIFVTRSAAGDGSVVHIRNRRTQQEATGQTPNGDIVVRLLPAVQHNGHLAFPITASEQIIGKQNARMGDGSVVPIPFRMIEAPINLGK